MPGKIRKRPSPPEFVMRIVKDVPLTFLNEAGDQVKENFTLQVKAFTEFGYLKFAADLKGDVMPNGVLPFTAIYSRTVDAIIDADGQPITDEQGNPAELNREFFAGMLPEDLEAIDTAIKADANPPAPTSSPGNSGSSTAASEV